MHFHYLGRFLQVNHEYMYKYKMIHGPKISQEHLINISLLHYRPLKNEVIEYKNLDIEITNILD